MQHSPPEAQLVFVILLVAANTFAAIARKQRLSCRRPDLTEARLRPPRP